MVRKWSYLNNNLPKQNDDYINVFIKKHRFKVFRASTRFKKFNVGITKVVRKLYSRQKRRTNAITLTFITADWLGFIFKSRQFYRFVQSYGSFALNVNSSNVMVLSKRIGSVLAQGGVNSYACTKTTLKALLDGHAYRGRLRHKSISNKHFLINKTGFSGNAGLMTSDINNHELLSNLGPNAAVLDRLRYSYDIGTPDKTEAQSLDGLIFNQVISQLVCTRQIMIHLTLLNINTVK